ncbi:hypothetical protein Tco_0578899 [Tanacetum coccineum]
MVGRVGDLRRWWVGLVMEAVLGSDGGGMFGSGEDDCTGIVKNDEGFLCIGSFCMGGFEVVVLADTRRRLMSTFKGIAINGSTSVGGYSQCALIYVAEVEFTSIGVGDGLWRGNKYESMFRVFYNVPLLTKASCFCKSIVNQGRLHSCGKLLIMLNADRAPKVDDVAKLENQVMTFQFRQLISQLETYIQSVVP